MLGSPVRKRNSFAFLGEFSPETLVTACNMTKATIFGVAAAARVTEDIATRTFHNYEDGQLVGEMTVNEITILIRVEVNDMQVKGLPSQLSTYTPGAVPAISSATGRSQPEADSPSAPSSDSGARE